MKLIALTIVVCFLAWCSAQRRCSCDSPFRVGQLDINQAPFTPYKQQRLTATSNYIRTSNFDVLCLESLWVSNEKTLVANRAKPRYPYSFSPPRKSATCNPQCKSAELSSWVTCLAGQSCHLNASVTNVLSCTNSSCASAYSRLSGNCKRCLSGLNATNWSDKLNTCAGFSNTSGLITTCSPLYGGETDVLILSRFRFVQTGYLYYNISPAVTWSAAYVRIIHPIFGPINIFATHLVPEVPFIDFSDENLAQAQQLLPPFVRSKVTNRTEIILLVGNFNSGPAGRALTAVFPNTYNYITSNGYTDSTTRYLTNPPCTTCTNNPLLGTTRVKRNAFVDHIFINNNASVCVSRAGTFATGNAVRIQGGRLIPFSDHYGLFTEICRSNTTIVRQTATVEAAASESESDIEVIEENNNQHSSAVAVIYTYVALLLVAMLLVLV